MRFKPLAIIPGSLFCRCYACGLDINTHLSFFGIRSFQDWELQTLCCFCVKTKVLLLKLKNSQSDSTEKRFSKYGAAYFNIAGIDSFRVSGSRRSSLPFAPASCVSWTVCHPFGQQASRHLFAAGKCLHRRLATGRERSSCLDFFLRKDSQLSSLLSYLRSHLHRGSSKVKVFSLFELNPAEQNK